MMISVFVTANSTRRLVRFVRESNARADTWERGWLERIDWILASDLPSRDLVSLALADRLADSKHSKHLLWESLTAEHLNLLLIDP